MATISSTPRPGYAWDATDNCWYPIGTGPHTHPDYITQSTAINPSTITTKGDLIVGTGAGTFVRQGVGTNGQLLAANSAQADGVEWVDAPTSGGMTLLNTTTLSGGTTTISSINQGYKALKLIITDAYIASGIQAIYFRFNSDSSSVYNYNGYQSRGAGTTWMNTGYSYIPLDWQISDNTAANNRFSGILTLENYTETSLPKVGTVMTNAWQSNDGPSGYVGSFKYVASSAISSISIILSGSTFSNGTVKLYGIF